MRFRRREAETIVVLRLLQGALVHIRAAAHEGDAGTARRLADAFHNAPAQLIDGSPDDVLEDVRSRCQRHGDGDLFAALLAAAKHA